MGGIDTQLSAMKAAYQSGFIDGFISGILATALLFVATFKVYLRFKRR